MSEGHYNRKLIVSGRVLEVYQYSTPVQKGRKPLPRDPNSIVSSESHEESRERALRRARATLRRLILSNVYAYQDDAGKVFRPVFLTLTFAENVQDLDAANVLFGDFLKRLNYQVAGKKCSQLRYSVVPEFQERGAVHYHVIFYNLPFVPVERLASIWGHGFVKIKAIDHVDNVGAYVCKYLTKESADPRLEGRKAFWSSRCLFQPIQLTGSNDDLADILEHLLQSHTETYTSTFENDYLGEVTYTQYSSTCDIVTDGQSLTEGHKLQRQKPGRRGGGRGRCVAGRGRRRGVQA